MALSEGVVYLATYTENDTEYYEIKGSKRPRRSLRRTETRISKDLSVQVNAVNMATATAAAENAVHTELGLECSTDSVYKGQPGVNLNHVRDKVEEAVKADNESYGEPGVKRKRMKFEEAPH